MAKPPAIETEFQVVLVRRTTRPSPWAPLGRVLERVVAALPTHRDTRSGRRNAQQVRMVLLATGVLTVVLWDSPWAPLALIACLVALVVPVSESKRRQWTAGLRARRMVAAVERTPATLKVDKRHITLMSGAERVRRLRRNILQVSTDAGQLELRAGGKKVDRMVVSGSDPDGEELWVDGAVDEIAASLQ